MKSYLMPAEVAELLAVTVETVRNLADSGEIRSMSTAGGHRRFRYRDILRYAQSHDLVLNIPERDVFNIMIVDDDEPYSMMLQETLESLPYRFEINRAANGFQAGFKIKQIMPDLVLLDIKMPGISGIDVAELVKEDPETSNVRIIAMTGSASQSNTSRMREAGAERILHKPFSEDELIKAIGEKELEYYSVNIVLQY